MEALGFGQEKTIGNYRYNLAAAIGKGYSATVYKGAHLKSGEPVAVKVIELKRIDNELEAMLLRNEVNCLQMLKHENIVEIRDQLQTRDRLYIVSELCEGGNLYDHIKKEGRFSEEVALATICQIVKAVNYIHGLGILHRDIKSGNVLVKGGMQVKLADFGFAGLIKQDNKSRSYTIGSPLYMSPQTYMHSQYSAKSDVWSIGMVLYQMLMGGQPFANATWEAVFHAITSEKLMATLPNNLAPFTRLLLGRMFQIDPNSRADTNEILNYVKCYLRNREKRDRFDQNFGQSYSPMRT